MSVAVKIENLSKQYRLGTVSTKTLSHDLNRWFQTNIRRKEDPYIKIGEINDRSIKGSSDYIWALKNINLEVQEGEILGIIGRNGAGKSTLLKILSKITSPTTGIIKTKGRVASLLEVGTGFHFEMSGRENIYLNGCIMGMTKTEITKKLEEIVDFAGIERYIDTPVKRYSSGMIVRLGFAIAAHLEPEILIVDEVLAVGDVDFQKKAIGKMQFLTDGHGKTILYVSHNLDSINQLCNKCLLLGNGVLIQNGKTEEVISKYLKNSYSNNKYDTYNNIIRFLDIRLNKSIIVINEDLKISVKIRFNRKNTLNGISLIINSESNVRIAILDLRKFLDKEMLNKHEVFHCLISIPRLNLIEGNYKIGIFIDSNEFCGNIYDIDFFTVIVDKNIFRGYHKEVKGYISIDFTVDKVIS